MTETRGMTLAEIKAQAVLEADGTRPENAAPLALAIMEVQRDGIASHGSIYLPTYAEHVRCGKVGGRSLWSRRRAPRLATVDAATGFAHPAIAAGLPVLVRAESELGIVALAVRNSHNCGVLGHHAERIAGHRPAALCFTNAPASIAPAGGTRPVVGTNHFALAVPDENGAAALVIDQSASVAARSEVMKRARAGEAIPEGWVLDAEGNPTTDPAAGLKGTMAPSGCFKGVGVGLMVELFASAMTGATPGIDAAPFSGTVGGPPLTGQFFIAIDPGPASHGAFAARLTRLIGTIEGQPRAGAGQQAPDGTRALRRGGRRGGCRAAGADPHALNRRAAAGLHRCQARGSLAKNSSTWALLCFLRKAAPPLASAP